MLVNEYSWHELLRRLARGVSSLHQAPKHRRKKRRKKKRERKRESKGGGREKKGGESRQTHTLDKDN